MSVEQRTPLDSSNCTNSERTSKEHSYAYEAGYRDGAINYELDHCPACKNVADLQEALDENARLRELVGASWKCIHSGVSCFDCRVVAGGCTLQSAMRELGVEVDE